MVRLIEAIDIAIDLAKKSDGPFKHGCLILSGKKIISRGNNHTRKNIGTLSVHAEMEALWRIYDSDTYDNKKAIIIRVTESGKLASSRPCHMCMAALSQHGVQTIVYSTRCGGISMERIS
jgi:tRNA(Arg) A34 adenosine deaminase TadA